MFVWLYIESALFLFAFMRVRFQLFAMDKAQIRHILVCLASDKLDKTQPVIEKAATGLAESSPPPVGCSVFIRGFRPESG